jgi:hypothetical protein
LRCRQKFLRFFPKGFIDKTYVAWEREYKWDNHLRWQEALHQGEFRRLLRKKEFSEIAARAVRVEQASRHCMLFSFEKMALRDAVRSDDGARIFATGLYDFLHGSDVVESRFQRWIEAVAALPRRQTRVLTWPLLTAFGFIAQPNEHIFLKPKVTRAAALEYGYDLKYASTPSWDNYLSLLDFAEVIRRDLNDLHPADMIDIQSFIWVQGSSDYED